VRRGSWRRAELSAAVSRVCARRGFRRRVGFELVVPIGIRHPRAGGAGVSGAVVAGGSRGWWWGAVTAVAPGGSEFGGLG